MPETKRQKIVAVIKAAIETISTDEGFETDIGETVDDWRTEWDEDELPAVSVCDLTEDVIEDQANEFMEWYSLPIQIRIFLSSADRPATARKMMADVVKAIEPLKDGFRGETEPLGNSINLKRKGFVLAEEGFKIAAIAVEIEIIYYTKKFNDYE